ncbi:5272_t:CDS:1, partial [Acaulospora colombiana]
FKDMFAAGESAPNQETMVLTEDCATLEYFLRHIDPAKETPQLDWDRVAGALQAAEKYQVNNIFKWFEREVDLSLTFDRSRVLPNPMLCLALARRYDLQMTARISLRQLIKCRIEEITGSPHVDSALLKQIFSMRTKRMRALLKIILECPEHPHKHTSQCVYASSRISYAGWRHDALERIISEPSLFAILASIRGRG